MKKIKKFKVNLQKRRIIRSLKLASGIEEITGELEEAITKEIEKSTEYISPASMFETFTIDSVTKKFGLQFNDSVPVAVSIIVVTVGNLIEKEIDNLSRSGSGSGTGGQLRSKIVHSIGLESLDSSLNFVYRLIKEEAKDEECNLIPLEKIIDEQQSKNIIKNFDTKRIGVSINAQDQLVPLYSSIAIVRWS